MTEYNKDNPRFRDEFGCVNDLLTGESYVCGESAMIGERDALDTAIALCDLLNNLYNENNQLKEQIKLIANAHTYTKQESVKEILRHEIWGIDSVAGESADAFHDYCVLSKFFKEHYSEDWDNFE